MTTLTIDVTGTPAPQGSKRAFVVNGRAVMAESSKKVKPWRQDVVAAVHNALAEASWETPGHAVEVTISFYLPRPGYHFRTGKRAHELKPNAPCFVDKKPDSDKLARSTLDALTTSAAIKDDAQVARLIVEKRYADGPTGARITITPLDPSTPAAPVTSTPPARQASPEGALF
jgi:Holliday junction resolvase RusA-like endonuclease